MQEKQATSLPKSDTVYEEEKSPAAFKTISEVADLLGVPQHVLRFWESRFPQIKPTKLRGGRRYYRPEDIEILTKIQHLLYKQGYTIKGAKKAFGHKEKADAAPPAESPKEKAKQALTDKQHSQLSVIRQELLSLREVMKPHLSKN